MGVCFADAVVGGPIAVYDVEGLDRHALCLVNFTVVADRSFFANER